MKLRYSIIFCWFAILIGCNHPVDSVTAKHRLIHNNDGTEILGNNWFGKHPLTLADVNQYVDMVANSQVTTFMICSGSDFFYYRSKYGRIIGDDKNGTLNCGENTRQNEVLKNLYNNALLLEKEGTDIIEATLKRAKEKSLEAFITYRMNDLHFADTTTHCSIQYTDFWREHPEWWTNDTTLAGWNSHNALDFAHKEVRDHKLGIIKEQLEKYDMLDGYELDFMRFIVYFKRNEGVKNAPLMTGLVKDIRNIVDSLSRVRNKKILLTARVPAMIETCIDKGLDVKEWVKQGLLDFVTLGIHWLGEPAMPVTQFKKDLEFDIPVYATIDDGGYLPREVYSHGMYRGIASHALAQGADGINLFNYFLTEYNNAGGQLQPLAGTAVCRTIAPELLKELGSLETLKRKNKIYSLSDGASSYRLQPNSPLPLKVTENAAATIYVGDNVRKDQPEEIILFVRTNSHGTLSVSINGYFLQHQNPAYPKLFDKLQGIKDNQKVSAYIVPAEHLVQGENKINFSSTDTGIVVQRIELALKYGAVEQYGFF